MSREVEDLETDGVYQIVGRWSHNIMGETLLYKPRDEYLSMRYNHRGQIEQRSRFQYTTMSISYPQIEQLGYERLMNKIVDPKLLFTPSHIQAFASCLSLPLPTLLHLLVSIFPPQPPLHFSDPKGANLGALVLSQEY